MDQTEVASAAAPEENHLIRWATLLVAALCGAVAAYALARCWAPPVGHDQTYELYASAEILRGVKLNGPELVEVNPPFLLWFMSLPVLLAKVLHLTPLDGFRVFLLGIAFGASAWSALLFRRLARSRGLLLWSFLTLVGVAGGIRILHDDLGQREHLLIFLLLPYLLAAAFRMERRKLPPIELCAVGLLAAVAICLKPQHLLDVAAVELLVLARLRSLQEWFNPAWLTFSLGLVLYFVTVRLLAPMYFTDIVPLLRASYWGMDVPLRHVFRAALVPGFLLTMGTLVYFYFGSRLRLRTLVAVLLAAGWGALGAFLQQHKGWPYQRICVDFFVFLAVGLFAVDLLGRWVETLAPRSRSRVSPQLASGLALAVFLLVTLYCLRYRAPVSYPEEEKRVKRQLADIYSVYPAGTPVSYLSVGPWEFPAIVEQNKVWASRYYHLWLLPAILRSHYLADEDIKDHLPPAEAERLATLLRRTTAEDLAHWRPVVVAIASCGQEPVCRGLEAQHLDSVLDWFLLDPDFRREWSRYSFQKSVDDTQVYIRKD